jgi:N6-adenosine-specific RNA methylase IME4
MFISNTGAPEGVQAGDAFAAPETAAWLFDPLPLRSYDLLVIDPPWPFKTWSQKGQSRSASKHYSVMTLAEIAALPVRELLKDDGYILLWTTGVTLLDAGAVIQGWGITYKTELVWRKVTPSGKPAMGLGFLARSMHEPILLGTVGRPRKITFPSLFDGIRREHSRKPEELYQIINERAPAFRRADLFAREKREGWDCWGDEVEKFSSAHGSAERNR